MFVFFENLLLILSTNIMGPQEVGGEILGRAELADYLLDQLEDLLEICQSRTVGNYQPEIVGFMEEVFSV